jgi:hypothetical protein
MEKPNKSGIWSWRKKFNKKEKGNGKPQNASRTNLSNPPACSVVHVTTFNPVLLFAELKGTSPRRVHTINTTTLKTLQQK